MNRGGWAIGVVLWAGAAHAGVPALLAPGLDDFQSELATTERRLDAAEALAAVAGAAQNAWLDAVGTAGARSRVRCDAPAASEPAARARAAGALWRTELQAGRAAHARLLRLEQADTVSPLLTDADHGRVQALAPRISQLEVVYAATSAWQLAHIEPWARGCTLPSPPLDLP